MSAPDAPVQGSRVARQARGTAGTARVRAKLKAAVEAGNFYEAHQMYRTLNYR